MPVAPDRLVEWLIDQCERRSWSPNEASVRAGLSRNAISSFIRRGPRIHRRPWHARAAMLVNVDAAGVEGNG